MLVLLAAGAARTPPTTSQRRRLPLLGAVRSAIKQLLWLAGC